MTNTQRFWPDWGSSGDKPADNINKSTGDPYYAASHNYLWSTLRSSFRRIDSELADIRSGKITVGQADSTTRVKGTDIDTNGDGIVDKADYAGDADHVGGVEGAVLTGRGPLATLPPRPVGDGQAVQIQALPATPTGTDLTVQRVQVATYDDSTTSFATPSGLQAVLYDLDSDAVLDTYGPGYSTPDVTTTIGGTNVGLFVDNGRFGTGTGSNQLGVVAGVEYYLNT